MWIHIGFGWSWDLPSPRTPFSVKGFATDGAAGAPKHPAPTAASLEPSGFLHWFDVARASLLPGRPKEAEQRGAQSRSEGTGSKWKAAAREAAALCAVHEGSRRLSPPLPDSSCSEKNSCLFLLPASHVSMVLSSTKEKNKRPPLRPSQEAAARQAESRR